MPDDDALRSVYRDLLEAWNRRSGKDFAAQFAEDGEVIGFDGSEMKGRGSIASEMNRIFVDHPTGEYVGKVKAVSRLMPQVAVVRAVAGVVPAGESDLNPALNSVQTLVLQKMGGRWWIVVYQSTPAQFHGRPEEVRKLTNELRGARERGTEA